MALDYNSGSIGVAFDDEINNITRIELKSLGMAEHRVSKRTLEIYYSDNNIEYTKLAEGEWEYERDFKGDIVLTIPQGISARYIKVHSTFVDWNGDFEVIDESQFVNGLEHIIKVYSRDDGAAINYEYDSVGKRTKKVLRTFSGNVKEYEYHYYDGTNRLRDYTVNGKNAYAYVYDEAGNLVKKGNRYSKEGNTVIFTETEGQGVECFEYEYNLQSRLSKVKKNGEVIAEFSYDADGMRVKAEEQLLETQEISTTYFVYGYSGRVLLEERSGDTTYTSFIYAFGKTFAKVDGLINTTTLATAAISYFHYDNLGSTRLMTNSAGEITFDQDYLPFGGDLPGVGQVEVQNDSGEGYKYTGQKQVVSIGLYYYGARYYDPEIGRFITEDPIQDGTNYYIYCYNNPLKYKDLDGLKAVVELHGLNSGIREWEEMNVYLNNNGFKIGGNIRYKEGNIIFENSDLFTKKEWDAIQNWDIINIQSEIQRKVAEFDSDGIDVLFPVEFMNNQGDFRKQGAELQRALELVTPDDTKSNVLAHSMGSLAAASYISGISGVDYANDIERLLTIGAPFDGSYLAYPADWIGDLDLLGNLSRRGPAYHNLRGDSEAISQLQDAWNNNTHEVDFHSLQSKIGDGVVSWHSSTALEGKYHNINFALHTGQTKNQFYQKAVHDILKIGYIDYDWDDLTFADKFKIGWGDIDWVNSDWSVELGKW